MDPYRSYKYIQDEADYPDVRTYQVKVGNHVNFTATGKMESSGKIMPNWIIHIW